MSSDLVAFLQQRLDEDEAVARAAQGQEIFFNTSEDAERFMRRWRTGRVLADVQAKRQILDIVFRYEATIDGEWACNHSADEIRGGHCPRMPVAKIPALLALTQPYAEHGDFDPAWRVSADDVGEHQI